MASFRASPVGSGDDDAISIGFDGSGSEGCGGCVATAAGKVAIGTNTFPEPGNEEDVRGFRP